MEIWISDDDNSWMFLVVMRWPVQTPANPSNTIVGRRRVGGVLGEGWASLVCGDIPHSLCEDTSVKDSGRCYASLSGENGLLWSNFHCGEPQTPDFGFVVVARTTGYGLGFPAF